MSNTSLIAYGISWFVAIILHINTLRRTALYNTKESVIEEIYSLIDIYKDEYVNEIDKELAFSHKNVRIERKIDELNTIYIGNVISLSHKVIRDIFTFDSSNDISKLKTICYDAVEVIDQNYHKKIQSHFSFFKLNRYEIFYTFLSALTVWIIVESISKFYENIS